MRRYRKLGPAWDAQRSTSLLWAPVAFGTGIGLYFALPAEPSLGLVGAVFAASALLLILGLWTRIALLVMLSLCILGLSRAAQHARGVAEPVIADIYYGPVAGRVVGIDRSSKNKTRVMLDRVHLSDASVVPARVRLVLRADTSADVLRPGALVMTTARLTPPPPPVEPDAFDFRRHAWFKGLGAIGSAPGPLLLQSPHVDTAGIGVFSIRMKLSDQIRAKMPERTGAFATAILTGDRSSIAPHDLINLRASNLAHLLAISGLHMGLLTGVAFLAIRWSVSLVPWIALRIPVKKVAAIGALGAGAAYLVISGGSVATQRAFIMAAVVLVAVLIDRPALTLRAVAVAALIVLALRPESLVGPGFQMSFAATIALIVAFRNLRDRPRWQALGQGWFRPLRAILVIVITSAVAGAATAPFAALHFHQVPQYGLIANILAVPAMGLVVMPAAALAFALWPVGGEWIGFWLMDKGISHILGVADKVAGWDGAVLAVHAAPTWLPGLLALALLTIVIPAGRVRAVGAVMSVLALALWANHPRPDVLISDTGRLVGVLGDKGRMLSRKRSESFAASVWLENDGDRASQKLAYQRTNPEEMVIERGDHLIWHWDTELGDAPCYPNVILIAEADLAPAVGPCRIFDKLALRASGATALYLDTTLKVVTVRQKSGHRFWTGAPLK